MNKPLALASVFDFFVRQSANEVGIREIGGSEQGRGMRRFFRPPPLSRLQSQTQAALRAISWLRYRSNEGE